MSYALVNAQLVKDNPHADGWFNTLTGGAKFACGRDWEASEPKDDLKGYTPDGGGQYGWEYNQRIEYIGKMGAIAPIGTFTPADMVLAGWTLTPSADWQLTPTSSYLDHRALWAYNGTPNTGLLTDPPRVMQATTTTSMAPAVQFHIWRTGPAPDEVQPPTFSIRFCGGANGEQYTLCLPSQGLTGKEHEDLTGRTGDQYPKAILYGKAGGDSTWAVVDTFGAGAAPELAEFTAEPTFQAVRVEAFPNALLIRIGTGDDWVVTGPWSRPGGQEVSQIALGTGRIEVRVVGGSAMFAMYQLTYPTSVTVKPWSRFILSKFYDVAEHYRIIGKTPSGTSISVVGEQSTYYGQPATKPVVTFATTDEHARACLYNIQEYHTASISAGVSNLQYTQGNANFVLGELSGETRADFQGSTMSATVSAAPGSALATIGANSAVMGVVNVHDGADYASYNYTDPDGTQYAKLFSGYADAPTKAKPEGPRGNMTATVSASDLIAGRLRKKSIGFMCSFEGNNTAAGWTVPTVFRYLLNGAGVPDSLIDIDAAVAAENVAMPYQTLPGKRTFKFGAEADFAQVIDTIVKAGWTYSAANPTLKRGLQWGVNPAGVVFLEPAYEWYSGKVVDWTLDAATTTVEDMVSNLRSERSLDDFRNFLHMMAGEGVDATAQTLVDEASWSNASAGNFIGDVWQQWESLPDGADVTAAARELWERIARWHNLIQWTQDDCPWIMPQDDVALVLPADLATDLELPTTGAVFTVVNKSWRAVAGGRYSQTLQAVRVQ